jgi:predicted CXXCH cytochrome family protein
MITRPALSALVNLLLLLNLFLLFAEQASAAPRLPSPKRECALCHIMWLTDFKRDDVTPLIPYDPRPVVESGKQDVSSTERMCLSCHDGWVLESRDLWTNKQHAHPVGQKPSEHIHIPTVEGKNMFPLNDDGKLYCGTCHTAHGVEWGATDSPVFMRVRSRDGKLCQACHEEKTKGPEAGTHPLNKELKKRPILLDTSSAKLSNDGKVTCQSCHSAHAAREDKLLVTRNDRSQLCAGCHDDQAAGTLAAAARLHTHPVNIIPTQARVPDSLKEHGARLGPDGAVICETCHKPHDARPEAGLLITANKQSSLCESCHQKQRQIAGGKHDMRLDKADSANVREQTAAEGGACSACHLPHQGKGPKMWAREPGSSQDAMAALCLSCHEEGALASKHQVGRYSHPVGVDIERLGRRVELPTYSRAGLKSVNASTGLVTCASCHDPHQWDPAHPGKNAKPGANSDANNSFLRKANGPDSELCRTCHEEKWLVQGSEHDLAKMAPDARNALDQTPTQSGLCSSCHTVHNGTGPRMWARALPARASPSSAPCLSCHNPDGVAAKKLVGDHSHPLDVPIADIGIRATLDKWTSKLVGLAGAEPLLPLPLFDRHGQRTERGGLVGCASCHDAHRWSPDSKADGFDVEGDASNSFLRISEHGNSELCVNCHSDKAVVSLSKHGLKRLALDKETPPGDGRSQHKTTHTASGVCSNCHQPHNTKGAFLWARNDGPGHSAGEKRCTSCHRDDGHAEDKQTGRYSHPLEIKVAASTPPEHLPLYTAAGKHAKRGGKVDCGSCHDPHQWQPGNPLSRSGQDPDSEGNASSSFLRLPATKGELCGECHRDKRQVLATDHDLSITAPEATNDHAQTAEASGLCGPCHSIHNATAPMRLWARPLGDGANPVEQTCRSCHAENAIARTKVPPNTLHPDRIKAWSEQLRRGLRPAEVTPLPVFDSEGRAALSGVISCASCHDPHQWQADFTQPAPGKNTEGDVSNSFLRLSSTASFLCADCHGLDSIFRYKYFHAEKAHREHRLAR